MRKIVDKSEYEREVNQENKQILEDFLIEMQSQGKAESTLLQYRNDLRIISYLIHKHFGNKRFTDMSRKEIRNLSILFRDMGMSNARVNRIMSALRSTLEFCADDDDYDYDFNVGSRVKGLPRVKVREITFLTQEQVDWLLRNLMESKRYLMASYLSLSYYSAKRKGEIIQVMKDGILDRFYTNTVQGKGGDRFKVYYNETTRDILKKYLEQRGDDDLPELFVRVYTTRRFAVTTYSFDNWCKYFSDLLSRREGRLVKINPHCFRHSRLENLRKEGVSIEKLKSLANHKSIATTESYFADRVEGDIADIFGMDPGCFN
jgi:integrase/recombinase XerD